jgi:hypothetical protein
MVKKYSNLSPGRRATPRVSASVDELRAAALDRRGQGFETGRSIVTFRLTDAGARGWH